MNLTRTQLIILDLLSEKGESYGLELVRASRGRLKRGTIYVLLNRLAEKGFVDSRLEDRPEGQLGSLRRLYHVTGNGATALDAYRKLETELGGLRPSEG